ncbi:MAG: type II toxin-antitoxin system RelE/ParE family toxin [Methylocystis sp.]|nr:type II toxin-antitoxin system RelE/ParE family toxin [Methylocystis sp.]MBI3275610.1 type II toxin-antitoxin system RelE/ParE family toxin [Methylocystis sp.]
MIKSFSSKALADLWSNGTTAKIGKQLHRRILIRLDALDQAEKADDMNLPGFDFHILRGFVPPRFTVHVNGPWCITFEFAEKDAYRVDLEQYH